LPPAHWHKICQGVTVDCFGKGRITHG
jgi:hypothetical protein